MKRFVALMLAIVLIVVFSISAYAADSKLKYIQTASASINVGTLSAKVKTNVVGISSVTKIKIKMELQKESSGVYSTVKTWENTYNSNSASMEESKLISLTGNYRLKSTITAYTSTDQETKTIYAY